MKTIGASVSDEYKAKIKEISNIRNEPESQFVIDACDRYLIELKEMEITRIFKPTIKMED